MKTRCDTLDVWVYLNTHRGLLTQDFRLLLKRRGQGTFHWVVWSPPRPSPCSFRCVTFLNSPAATICDSPGCTVYNQRANRRIFFLGGICRTWDVCIYKYIIYINIYNTDLKKNQIPLTYIFFNLCQKCVFRENLIFILRLCIVTHLYKCASLQHGPGPRDLKCHTHKKTVQKRLAFPLPVTLTSPPNFLTLINL